MRLRCVKFDVRGKMRVVYDEMFTWGAIATIAVSSVVLKVIFYLGFGVW